VDIDLSNYILVFDESHPNELAVDCEVSIVTDENPNTSPYFFSITSEFNDLEFEYVFGYFAQYEVNLGDTIELDIFDLNQEGHFEFGPGSVKFDFNFHNSYGLPMDVESKIKGIAMIIIIIIPLKIIQLVKISCAAVQ